VTTKRIATRIAIGIWIIFVVLAMAWQVVPASAGFSPTPPGSATETPSPEKSGPPVGTPEMPVTGGQPGAQSNSGFAVVLLAGMTVLLLFAFSVVIRQSARTKTEK